MSERYIVIPNWDRFQHYKGQERPAWIKVYTHLLHDDAYLGLTMAQKLTLHGLWLVYAESGCRVRLSTASLQRQLGHRVTSETLNSLKHAGFVDFALEPLYSNSSPRREEKNKKVSTSLSVSQYDEQRESSERGNGWVENLSAYTGCRYVRGEVALSAVYDPLGTERPPFDWPHERPKRAEIKKALEEQANA
jgi:hypothetical protein